MSLGWHGLVAAKTHLDLHPSAQILVLDMEKSIGGTWAKERLYPSLKSNNMLGTYEYSDFPMDEATYGVKPGEHIPGPLSIDTLPTTRNILAFTIRSDFKLRLSQRNIKLVVAGSSRVLKLSRIRRLMRIV